MAGALLQTVIVLVLYALVLTFLGMFALKYFVRQLPLLSHAMIFFWAVFRVLLTATALWAVVFFLKIKVPSQLSGLFGFACVCAVGWLLSHDLEHRYGVRSSKFPGPGGKVILSLIALTCVYIGITYLVSFLWAAA
jgi:hypothetical protein